MYSSESFGIGKYPTHTNWISLRETLASLDLELIVVITCRHYYEWMLSSKLHVEKWTGAKPKHNKWPNSQGGKSIEPFVPPGIAPGSYFYYPFYYIEAMLSMIRPLVPETRILNLHGKQTITSTLLCDVLPNTQQTCKHSLNRDNLHDEFRANAQNIFRDGSLGKKQTISFYDLIATTAADMGLINTTLISRRAAGLECQHFHQVVLNRTLADLPLQCPSQQHLGALLNESLAKEKNILPGFYRTHQDEHRSSFWKSVKENKFCMVNASAVLVIKGWRDFVTSLGRAKAEMK